MFGSVMFTLKVFTLSVFFFSWDQGSVVLDCFFGKVDNLEFLICMILVGSQLTNRIQLIDKMKKYASFDPSYSRVQRPWHSSRETVQDKVTEIYNPWQRLREVDPQHGSFFHVASTSIGYIIYQALYVMLKMITAARTESRQIS